jgi:hypothetical protein
LGREPPGTSIEQKKIIQHRFLLSGSLIAAAWVIARTWLVIDLRLRYAVKIAAPLIKNYPGGKPGTESTGRPS